MASFPQKVGKWISIYSELKKDPQIWSLFTKREEYNFTNFDKYDRLSYKTSSEKNILAPVVSQYLVKNGFHYEYEDEEIIRTGRIVQHPTFGRGKVVKTEGSGESLRLEIHFTGIGTKKILAKFAKLKIIG